ncbi:MAG: Tetrathionate reductase subunit B [Fimbriimonadaceae bacterium]|nr:Tetrathionate reductase subunit B [Fimbriimonadaceae bacterium]
MSDESYEMSRKEMLQTVGRSVLLIAAGVAGGAAAVTSLQNCRREMKLNASKKGAEYPGSPWYAMAIDIEKCIGCGLCVQACSVENNVPSGHFRTWIERYVVKKDGSVVITSPNGGMDGFEDEIDDADVERAYFVPKLCNHCDDSPCTQVCPVGATFETKEGVVLVDYDWCVGCRYCIQACPYGSRFWNPVKNTADKCTLCYHRLKQGKLPACVEVCPTGARIFGDLSDEKSPVSKFISENPTMVMKPHLKTEAKVRYKGLSKEVV